MATAFPPQAPSATFPFRIVGKVGEGGMGAVYRAQDVELGRCVAIKVIRPELIGAPPGSDAQSAAQRFQQEARAAAALTHPGVTTVYRAATEDGTPYIAMEWLDGHTLEELLVNRRFTVEQAARIGLQVLAVLEEAHAAGVVHRDIKPGNLMVLANGRIKVMDFGVARMRDSALAQTRAGVVIGTPHYAAPEQLAGEAVDSRADLYALAAVLYEVIVGHPPFEATSLFEQIHAVHTQAPTPPSALVADVPAAFDVVLLTALAKRAEDRFATAAAMSAALRPFKNRSVPLPTPPATAPRASERPVPTMSLDGDRPAALVAGALRGWPATALGRQPTATLLPRLLERPLHAPAFCGALAAGDAWILISDGIIYGAFEPATARTGDAVLEALAPEVDATIAAAPEGGAHLVPLLASLLVAPEPGSMALDPSLVDVGQLVQRLEAQGFDGALRLQRDRELGFALWSRGQRVLTILGRGWPSPPETGSWAAWLAATGAQLGVEPRRTSLPAMTYRQQLRDLVLEVVRPAPAEASLRSDTVAEARRLALRPRETTRAQLRRGESTIESLVAADPAYHDARWVLAELAGQFAQFGRDRHWRALIEPLPQIDEVTLHRAVARAGGHETFDAVGYLAAGGAHHVLDRVAHGTAEAVTGFLARAIAVKESGHHPRLAAAILFAPRFDDAALAAYLSAVGGGGQHSIFARLEGLGHREGYVRLGARAGLHVLLVEDEEGGRRRPLVTE